MESGHHSKQVVTQFPLFSVGYSVQNKLQHFCLIISAQIKKTFKRNLICKNHTFCKIALTHIQRQAKTTLSKLFDIFLPGECYSSPFQQVLYLNSR